MKPNPAALLIDDDKANRRQLRELLQSQHYRLLEAENGLMGLAAAKVSQPDVIILELALPDMSGLAVLEKLRQFGQTPVLALSVRHKISRAPTETLGRSACGAIDHRFRRLFFLTSLEAYDPSVLVTEDSVNDHRRHKSRKAIRIPEASTESHFWH